MDILIAGSGGLGSLAGAYLADNHEVTLFGRKAHSQTIADEGLLVRGVNGEQRFHNLNAIWQPLQLKARYDLIILGAKAYDTFELLKIIDSKSRFNFIASIQNGLKDENLVERYGIDKVLGCVLDEAASYISPGVIEYRNKGISFLGNFSNKKSHIKWKIAEELVSSLEGKLGYIEPSEEMDLVTWYKFMTIVPVFCLQGAYNQDALQMTSPEWREIYKQLIVETKAIALASKVRLKDHKMLKGYYLSDDIDGELDKLNLALQKLEMPPVASLLQDLRKGKRSTEATYTIWPMIRKARQHGIYPKTMIDCYCKIAFITDYLFLRRTQMHSPQDL